MWLTGQSSGELEEKRVEEVFVNETNEIVHVRCGDTEIDATPTHPFYTPDRGWVSAVNLRAGDRLQLVNGEYVTVEQVQHEILENPITVYNFRVADNHTYYVGDSSNAVLVHNMNCNFELPKTVKSKKGVSGNFSESGFTYRIDTNKIAPGEGGFHLHVMQKGKEVAKLNGFGGYVKNHKGRTLLKPSQMNKNVRKEINKLIKHVQKNL